MHPQLYYSSFIMLFISSTTPDPAVNFNDFLNSIHERVQFTREEEKDNSIAFLDVLVTRENTGDLSTRI